MALLAYFDCFSGASGDMILGALVDAGLGIDKLQAELASLRLSGYRLWAEPVRRAGIAATRVHVDLDGQPQPQRCLRDIRQIIDGSDLPRADRERAGLVFRRLAEAEAAVHGTGVEEIHFHEVGAVDAIVDIVGAVVGLRLLGVTVCYASALPSGSGTARSAHGQIPVPAPAVLDLLARAGAPLRPEGGEQGELVTPTGAALLTTLARFERPALTLQRTGYGAGGRDPADRPNVLRLWLGTGEPRPAPVLLQIETNIDDMPAEHFGYVQELLFAAGAVDVWFTPIQMKKNRPATLLALLCPPAAEAGVAAVLLRETSTLGLRVHEVRRHEAERASLRFSSSLGEAEVKLKRLSGEPVRIAPEYESARALALSSRLPLAQVYRIIQTEAEEFVRREGKT